jgi:hypothetical protein
MTSLMAARAADRPTIFLPETVKPKGKAIAT